MTNLFGIGVAERSASSRSSAPGFSRWLHRAHFVVALLAASLLGMPAAYGQATNEDKIARDLQTMIAAATTPSASWAKDVNGVRYVKVLVVATTTDPDLVALRSDVLTRGGSVYFRYVSVATISALLPTSEVVGLAARSDVQSISPNRLAARTASTLEYTTGTLGSGVRTYSS